MENQILSAHKELLDVFNYDDVLLHLDRYAVLGDIEEYELAEELIMERLEAESNLVKEVVNDVLYQVYWAVTHSTRFINTEDFHSTLYVLLMVTYMDMTEQEGTIA
jgi:hypothetical protein